MEEHKSQIILNEALSAVRRSAGLEFTASQSWASAGRIFLDLMTRAAHTQFVAEILTVRNFATLGLISHRYASNPYPPPLLVAPYVTRALAEQCRDLRIPFIDTAGNAYIDLPGLLIFVTGEPRPVSVSSDHHQRAYTEVGMKVIFALLCKHELADATYRELAEMAQVGLGTLGPVLRELENRGNLVQRGRRRELAGTKDLMEAWVIRYPDVLRPKLVRNRYQVDVNRIFAQDLSKLNAYWGAEVAADRLTGYLHPEHFTIYVRSDAKRLLTESRARLDLNGNMEVLQTFWNFSAPEFTDVVPPLLVYADLMATQDGRNLETARLIYDRFLEPAHRS